jgi:hypothetical protein
MAFSPTLGIKLRQKIKKFGADKENWPLYSVYAKV